MNIVLLTIWHDGNYGAELQAYSTVKYLEELGHNVRLLNIRLSDFSKSSLNGKISKVITYFNPGPRKLRRFWSMLPKTERYHTLQELQSNPPKGDMYLVGSDQVWNPAITKAMSRVFFLDFGGYSVKRCSYASSFGTSNFTPNFSIDEVSILLKRFANITCREESGIRILKDSFNIESKCVLDPTLMYGSFQDMTGNISQKNNVVYYPLGIDFELGECANQLGKILNCKVINNAEIKSIFGKIMWDRVGIEQWVKNIAEARFVITRSFHGMIFSILHQKQFAIISSGNGRETRLLNLINKLGLEDRFFETTNDFLSSYIWKTDIDYDIVTPKLHALRNESREIINKLFV